MEGDSSGRDGASTVPRQLRPDRPAPQRGADQANGSNGDAPERRTRPEPSTRPVEGNAPWQQRPDQALPFGAQRPGVHHSDLHDADPEHVTTQRPDPLRAAGRRERDDDRPPARTQDESTADVTTAQSGSTTSPSADSRGVETEAGAPAQEAPAAQPDVEPEPSERDPWTLPTLNSNASPTGAANPFASLPRLGVLSAADVEPDPEPVADSIGPDRAESAVVGMTTTGRHLAVSPLDDIAGADDIDDISVATPGLQGVDVRSDEAQPPTPAQPTASQVQPLQPLVRHGAPTEDTVQTAAPESGDAYAQTIIADALAQAALITSRAEASADDLIAQAREDGEQQLNDTRVAAGVLREQAEAIVAAGRRRADQIAAAAEERSRQARDERAAANTVHQGELATARKEHENELRVAAEAAQAESEQITARAGADAAQVRAEAGHDAAAVRKAAQESREEADRRNEAMLLETRQLIAAELAEVREQTTWTKQTIDALLAAAEADAEKIRREVAAEAEATTSQAHDAAAQVAQVAQAAADQRAESAHSAAQEVQDEAAKTLAEAQADAGQIRMLAGDDAEAILAQAVDRAAAITAAAARRQDEAEASARVVRQSATDDLARAQDEVRELRRKTRTDVSKSIAEARAEADELRSRARAMLSEARAEVSVLTAHRDEISKQLGELSGVIDALAVPENPKSDMASSPDSNPRTTDTDEGPTNS